MSVLLPIFFLLVVLKIPVFAMIWLVWWANPESTKPEASNDDGGSSRIEPDRPPHRPFGPRRDPHGSGQARPEPTRRRRPNHAEGIVDPARARETSRSAEINRR